MNVVSLRGNIDPSYYRLLVGRETGSLVDTFEAKRPSVAERLAAGKVLREQVPRAAHARYDKHADRPDPVAILEQQNVTRVQKLVPVRYARMLTSSFSFLRGSAAVMASDLSRTPVTGLSVGACGDMHVSNFGVYASAERNLVFAINDFDEIHPGPWEWDLKRLAASAAVAVRFMGGDNVAAQEAARACVRSYRRRMRRYAGMGHLEVWYDRIDEGAVLAALSPKVRRNAERVIAKARAKGHIRSLDKLTEQVDGEHRIVEDAPLIVRETHTERGRPIRDALNEMLHAYVDSLSIDRRRLLARYRIVDVARKVVGVGSVSTECWVILLQGINSVALGAYRGGGREGRLESCLPARSAVGFLADLRPKSAQVSASSRTEGSKAAAMQLLTPPSAARTPPHRKMMGRKVMVPPICPHIAHAATQPNGPLVRCNSMEAHVVRGRSLALSMLLMVGACAGSPSAPPQADQEAKRFDQPAPDKGAVYVYRSGVLGMLVPIDVKLAGGASAQLAYNTFIRVEGPPGQVDIGCKVGDKTGNGQIQIQDGQTRYVEVSMTVGLVTPGCEVAEVSPDQGQAAVRSSRRVEPL